MADLPDVDEQNSYMMKASQGKKLLKKYLKDRTVPQEEIIVESFYQRLVSSGEIRLSDEEIINAGNRIHTKLLKRVDSLEPLKKKLFSGNLVWRIAAGIVIIGTCFYLYRAQLSNNISPGKDQAILTLADGREVILGEQQSKSSFLQGKTKVTDKSGWLTYTASSTSIGQNKLTVPRGGQYKVILPDGSRVWLNAETTLEYPTAFDNKQREITLSGEAFFEVVHNQSKPFIVKVNGVNVNVLGTSFNVDAYGNNKNVTTTVASGLVGITHLSQTTFVKPGEQALFNGKTISAPTGIDLEEITAWKDGLFRFNGAELSKILEQLSRWYNVDFEINDHLENVQIYAVINRGESISHVIEILEATGKLHFETSGHQIVVTRASKK